MPRHNPAEQWDQLGHKLPVKPEGGDRPVSHHYANEPHNALVMLWDHWRGHPAVHAALLPLREPPPAQPGRCVPAGLLYWGAGGPSGAADAGTADGGRHTAAQRLSYSGYIFSPWEYKKYLTLYGQKYMGTQTLHPYVIIEDLILTPRSLICCYNSLHCSGFSQQMLNLLQGLAPTNKSVSVFQHKVTVGVPVHPRCVGWSWGQGSVQVLPHQTGKTISL